MHRMADAQFTVLDLLSLEPPVESDALNLVCLAGRSGVSRAIKGADISRPGLALTGFYEAFAYEQVQLMGAGEAAWLARLEAEGRRDLIERFLSYPLPCVIFCRGDEPSALFLSLAEEKRLPVLQTSLDSTEFSQRLIRILSNIFAPRKTLHGVLVEVFGVGILLTGESGVGKSETALELVQRGHRLVADDVVEVRCVNGSSVIGQGASPLISHHMEIRGLGIINIAQLYGVGAIRRQKEVQLVVKLEDWQDDKVYDRLGTAATYTDLLGVKIPFIEIPVKPGRNLPVIIEVAAMNERLKSMGYFSAQEFNHSVLRWIEAGDAQNTYYRNDDSY